MSKRKPRRKKPPKTRAGGRMTESAFWGRIRSALRKSWRAWPPRNDVLRAATRPVANPTRKQRVETRCNECGGWFSRDRVSVDHVVPCGHLCRETAGEFIERMFVESSGLQVLCDQCHNEKTQEERHRALS